MGWTCSGRSLSRNTNLTNTSTRSLGCFTGRNAKRDSEGRDFSRDPRSVSFPGFRRLCWSVLWLVFLCLSVLSRAVPKLSLSTRPQRYRLSGVSDKAIRSALTGRPCRTPRTINGWSLTDRKRRNGEKSPKSINKGLKFLTDM